MTTLPHDQGHAILRPVLQSLVTGIGLLEGRLQITVHEGQVTKIDVHLTHVVNGSRSNRPPGAIRVACMDQFIKSRLEETINRIVNRFGYVEVNVDDGTITGWGIHQKHR